MTASSAASALRIELLGAPGLVDAAGKRIALERKAAALLALLALDGVRSRVGLAVLLWPDAPVAQARNSLRQRVFRLQRSVGVELVAGQDDLRLAPGIGLDLADAHAALLQDPRAPIGQLLEGLQYDDTVDLAAWVDAARDRWRSRRSDWLAELAARHEAQQQIALALQYAQRLLADEPLLEHAHRRVMRLHYLRGDRGAALAAYDRCKALLRDTLGTTPDRETRSLASTIESAGPSTTARALAPPVAVLRPPQLVGRDLSQARLAAAIAARQVLLLDGEPGIGKSRLFEELAQSHPALVRSGAQAGDARLPYALLARLAGLAAQRWNPPLPDWVTAELARLVPAFGAVPSARLDPLRLQQAFSAALGGWSDAGLQGLIVDDLQHADDASLECLMALALPTAPPLAWLFGVRTQEMPPALQSWLEVNGPRVDQVRLGLLDADEIGDLLESLQLGQFDAQAWRVPLARHSGGNPLFALETVRALLALGSAAPAPGESRLPVPAALDALLERRLAQLSPAALKLARIAALAGPDFDADLAATVLEAHPLDIVEPWRELEAAQLLDRGRFTHDLIAETALRALPAGIAQALHARLADALLALRRGPARIAPHWAEAQAWDRAGEAYTAAARDARHASRRADEMALWEHAADSFDRAGQAGRAFDARADSVECVILVRGVEVAARLVDRLEADQRTEPQRMRVLTSRACVCLMGGQAPQAEAAARSALDAATRLGAQWPRFEAARLLAVALAQAGRAADALAAIEPFRDLVVAHGDAEQRHHFWADYAYALKAAQRAHDTAHALQQAMASAEEAGDHAELATLTSNLALVEGNLGRVEQALDCSRRARALNDPLGVAFGPPSGAIELYVSMHEGALGRYTEALAGFERARACFAGNPGSVWIGLTANHLAHVLIHLGQFARAGQALQWTGTSSPATQARRALLQWRIDRARAQPVASPIERTMAELAAADPLTQMLLRLESTLSMAPADAVAACAELRDEAERHEHLAVGMRARLLELRHRTEAGLLARDQVEETAARLRRVHPADTYFGEAWWIVSRALDALAETDASDRALREAFDWVATRALLHVPAEFRDSFLNRNPCNRDLLAAAARRLQMRVRAPAITPG